jgi:hypothetical protein
MAVAVWLLFVDTIGFSNSVSVGCFGLRRSLFNRRKGGNCSYFGGWRDQIQVRLADGFWPRYPIDRSDKSHFTCSMQGKCAPHLAWL